MGERDWLFTIGPFDATAAHDFRARLQSQIGDEVQVDLIDDRVWFAGAFDFTTVNGVIPVLEAGLAAGGHTPEQRQMALSWLGHMRMWLNDEYDPVVDRGDAEDGP